MLVPATFGIAMVCRTAVSYIAPSDPDAAPFGRDGSGSAFDIGYSSSWMSRASSSRRRVPAFLPRTRP